MSNKSSLSKNLLWDFISVLTKFAAKFILSIILARLLTPNDFGVFAVAMVFVDFSMLFVNGGYSSAIIKIQSRDNSALSSIFILNVIFGLIFSVILLCASGYIGSFYENVSLSLLLKFIAFLPLIKASLVVPRALLFVEEKFKLIAVMDAVSMPISGTLGVILALNDFGPFSMVYMVLLQELIIALLVWRSVRWVPSIILNLTAISNFTSYGRKIFYVNVLSKINQTGDALVIGKLLGAESLGFYNRAKSFEANINSLIGRTVARVVFPRVSAHKMLEESAEMFQGIFAKQVIVLFLLNAVVMINIEEVFLLLFSSKWINSIPYVRYFLLIGFTRPLFLTMQSMLKGIGELAPLVVLEKSRFILGIVSLFILWKFSLIIYLKTILLNAFLILFACFVILHNLLRFEMRQFLTLFLSIILVVAAFNCTFNLLFKGTWFDAMLYRNIFFLVFSAIVFQMFARNEMLWFFAKLRKVVEFNLKREA